MGKASNYSSCDCFNSNNCLQVSSFPYSDASWKYVFFFFFFCIFGFIYGILYDKMYAFLQCAERQNLTVFWQYREWVGKGVAVFLFWVVAKMMCARRKNISDECNEIVVCKTSDQTTMESVVSAQHGLRAVYELVQMVNISMLKLWSIFISKARKVISMPKLRAHGFLLFYSTTEIFEEKD